MNTFIQDTHYRSSLNLADEHHMEIEIDATHWQRLNGTLASVISISSGACELRFYPSASQCRELGNLLLEYASEVEAHQAQIDAIQEVA